jgi:hypothetical protein
MGPWLIDMATDSRGTTGASPVAAMVSYGPHVWGSLIAYPMAERGPRDIMKITI